MMNDDDDDDDDDDESKTELDHFLRLRLRFVPLFPHTNIVARFNRSTIFCFFPRKEICSVCTVAFFFGTAGWPKKITGAVSVIRRKSEFKKTIGSTDETWL